MISPRYESSAIMLLMQINKKRRSCLSVFDFVLQKQLRLLEQVEKPIEVNVFYRLCHYIKR